MEPCTMLLSIKGFIVQHHVFISAHRVVPVHSPCPQSIILTYKLL